MRHVGVLVGLFDFNFAGSYVVGSDDLPRLNFYVFSLGLRLQRGVGGQEGSYKCRSRLGIKVLSPARLIGVLDSMLAVLL